MKRILALDFPQRGAGWHFKNMSKKKNTAKSHKIKLAKKEKLAKVIKHPHKPWWTYLELYEEATKTWIY
jgi:hypothetical protein